MFAIKPPLPWGGAGGGSLFLLSLLSLLIPIVFWSWHEGILGLLTLFLLATANFEVYEYVCTLADTAGNLCQHTISCSCLNLVSLEGVALKCPNLQRSLYVLYLFTLLQQGLVGHET